MESLPGSHNQRHRVTGRERKRAAQACDSCRRQKEKCEGDAPCRRCARLGHRCEFTSRASRRAAVAGAARPRHEVGDAPLQEPTSASVAHRVSPILVEQNPTELANRVAYLESIIQRYTGNAIFDLRSPRNLAQSSDQQPTASRPAPPQPNVPSSRSESVGVDDQGFCIKPLGNNITHYSGEFSHWNFSMRIKQWIDRIVPPNDHREDPPGPIVEYYRAEELQSPSDMATSVSFLPPRFVTDFLVDAFFTHAQANYWYVERGWLTKTLEDIYENAHSLSRRDVGAICLIFMVLAIGTQYAYLESYAERLENSAHKRPGPHAGAFSEDALGVTLYQQACRLVPDVITVSSLESVQACMLIGIYTLPLDASGLSYIYLNLAVKLAIQNGMHRRYSGEGLDASVWETRNRVWWTVYTIERRVGIFHGRPLSIPAADVDVDLPVDTTDKWPSTTASHTAQFLATLRLNQLLSEMSHEISALRKSTRQELSVGVDRILELRCDLVFWWNSLPDDTFSNEEFTSHSSVSRSKIHLKLEYCLTRIFVGRVFIFPRKEAPCNSNRSSASARATTGDNVPSAMKGRSRSLLVADCIEASLEVVEICKLLRDSIGLARASYTEFSACRAALLVITTQCLQRNTDRFRTALKNGLSMLKEMSAGGDSARSETYLIEAFEQAVAKIDAATAEGRADSEYSRFKKWEQLWNSSPSADTVNERYQGMSVAASRRGLETQPLRQGGMVPMPSNTPFFGIDGSFASFPQTLDQFSSFLGYDPDPGPDSAQNENTWMHSEWKGV